MALLLGPATAPARLIASEMFSYESLAKQADTILIVSVETPSERTGEQSSFHGAPVDGVRTRFKVQAVLKGSFKADSYELNHLAYPRGQTEALMDEWGFVWFAHKHDQGLVFLKTGADGKLEPVTGQEDIEPSFVRLAANMGSAEKRVSTPAPAPEPAALATNTVAAIAPAPVPPPARAPEPGTALGPAEPAATPITNTVSAVVPLPDPQTVAAAGTGSVPQMPATSNTVPVTVLVPAVTLDLDPEPMPAPSPPLGTASATNALPLPLTGDIPPAEPKPEPVPVAGQDPQTVPASTNPVPATSIQPPAARPTD